MLGASLSNAQEKWSVFHLLYCTLKEMKLISTQLLDNSYKENILYSDNKSFIFAVYYIASWQLKLLNL